MAQTPATTVVQPVATGQGTRPYSPEAPAVSGVVGDPLADRVGPQFVGIDVAEDKLHIRTPALAAELRAGNPDAFAYGTSGQPRQFGGRGKDRMSRGQDGPGTAGPEPAESCYSIERVTELDERPSATRITSTSSLPASSRGKGPRMI